MHVMLLQLTLTELCHVVRHSGDNMRNDGNKIYYVQFNSVILLAFHTHLFFYIDRVFLLWIIMLQFLCSIHF
jgi:hypothetical protein